MSRPDDAVYADLLALDDEAPEAPTPRAELRDAVLASVAPATRLDGFAARLARFLDLPPERARELLRRVDHAGEAPWVGDPASVRLLHFEGGPRRAGADCGLVHIAPGVRFPRHRHRGDEWSFVLSGFAEEEDTGRKWAPGDLVRNPAGSAHAFRAVGREPFVFALVLRDGIELEENAG